MQVPPEPTLWTAALAVWALVNEVLTIPGSLLPYSALVGDPHSMFSTGRKIGGVDLCLKPAQGRTAWGPPDVKVSLLLWGEITDAIFRS